MSIAVFAVKGSEFLATPRCAHLQIRCLGLKRTVTVAGFGEAIFPNKTEWAMEALRPGDVVKVEWRPTVLHGHDPIIGRITARLLIDRARNGPDSLVTSLSPRLSGPFFPARSRCHMPFRVTMHRFGVTLESSDPHFSSAVIHEIPPVGAVYEMESPQVYQPVPGSSKWNWLLRSTTLEKCVTRFAGFKGIRADVSLIQDDGKNVTLSLRLLNETAHERVRVMWMVWPEPPCGTSGFAMLGRDAATVLLRLDRNVLGTQRWLAVVALKPFGADAAQAVKIPVI